MTDAGIRGTISCFQRRGYDAFYWKMDTFPHLDYLLNSFWRSPAFNFRGQKGNYLRLYPNGSKESRRIELYFISDVKASSKVHLTLGVKTKSGSIETYFNICSFFPNSSEIGSTLFKHDDFLKRKGELAPSNCITFVLFLSRDALHIIRAPTTPVLFPDVLDRPNTGQAEEVDVEEESEKKGVEKVAGDIAKLLDSGEGSDATIVVQGVEYKVHSLILAARAPVFAALFKHDTLEKETRKVTISDCEPTIFKEFLNYIYSGSVQDLTAEKSLGLYVVADKYLIKDLKEDCRRCIQENLGSETFCEAVQIALRCKDEDLLESAFDYFAIHFRHIIRSVEWQTYIEESPREANEIFIRSLGPP